MAYNKFFDRQADLWNTPFMLQDTPSFLAYWRNARSRTVRVLEALEPEDLEWAPVPGAFTFGDLFRHRLGLERFMYAETRGAHPKN